MKKKTKISNSCADDNAARDWKLLLEAFRDLTEWALDIVAQLSRDDSDALAAINGVRDFVRAVQQIPEEAGSRSAARLDSPVLVPDVSVTSIDVTPLDSPAEVAIEPLAPGEP